MRDPNLAFGIAVQQAREALGMNRGEFGAAMGVRGDMMGKLERGERRWTIAHMKNAADALGTSISVLLGEQGSTLSPLESAVVAVMRSSGERAAIGVLLDSLVGTASRT